MENKKLQTVYGITDKIPSNLAKTDKTSFALENVDIWFDEIPKDVSGFLWEMKIDNSVIPSKYFFEKVSYIE